jgi:hypothetical protein
VWAKPIQKPLAAMQAVFSTKGNRQAYESPRANRESKKQKYFCQPAKLKIAIMEKLCYTGIKTMSRRSRYGHQ